MASAARAESFCWLLSQGLSRCATQSRYPSTEQQIPRAKDALRNDKVVGTKVDEASDKVGGAIIVDGFVNIR